MEHGFLTDILLNGVDGDVRGLEDLNIPITQDSPSPQEVDDSHVVEVQPKKVSKRTRNFHFREDEVICSGWLNISKDPINGANQNRATFWGRVHAYFEMHKKTVAVRSESSIMHRWLTIQLQVNKYCACYDAIERRNQSGATIQDMVCINSHFFHSSVVLYILYIF